MTTKLIAVSVLILVIMLTTQVVFAADPPVIEIVIEEKITVGDGSKPAGESINESIGVNDEVNATGDAINESISVNDQVETEITNPPVPLPTATATPMPTATATPMPTATATPMPKPIATKATPRRNPRPAVNTQEEKRRPVAQRPTPETKSRNPFSRGTGQVVEEPTSVTPSGSCNASSGYESISMMALLLFPAGLKLRRRKRQ